MAAGSRQPGEVFPLTWEQTKHGLVVLGILILWVIGLSTIGFLVCSLAALCAIAVCFDPHKTKKNILRDIVVCLVIGIIVYVMFGYLGVNFPRVLLI